MSEVKMIISKELLREVLEFNEHWFVDTYYLGDNILNITAKSKANEKAFDYLEENIYELAHKCKEWAFKNSEIVVSFKYGDKENKTQWIAECNEWRFRADTDPEAIFKACQWVLENKGD